MTITEMSEKYKIPLALLQRYATEKTEAKGTDKKQRQADSYRFTDNDIEQLSVRMTLQDIGFAEEEIEVAQQDAGYDSRKRESAGTD